MRVLFLSSYSPYAPSTRYRVTQFLPYLERSGITCDLVTLMSQEFFGRFYEPGRVLWKSTYLLVRSLRVFWDVIRRRDYDIVFVQREALLFGPPIVEWLVARGLRKPLVFDLDDAIFLPYTSLFYGKVASLLKVPSKVPIIMRMSAHVVACNEYTRDFARQYNPCVTVIPPAVDAEVFRPIARDGQRVPVVGWLGSPSTARYLMPLLPVFERLARDHDFVLKIVGAGRTCSARGVRLEQKPYDLRNDVAEFQDMDIGVFPLLDEPWAWGKPGLKAVQYMAVGIPMVASPVGGVAEMIRDGECGFFARTDGEWLDRLARLLADEPLRRRMGEQGRKLVEERYCVQVQAPVLSDIFDRVRRSHG